MDKLLFLCAPWILCVVLCCLLRRERDNRKDVQATVQKKITNAQADATVQIEMARRDADSRIAQVEAKAQSDLQQIRQQAEQRIREEKEAILADKTAMNSLSDKELLIECLTAMNTYAQRLNRLENRVSNLAISLDALIKKNLKEKKPYAHVGVITDDDLISIVNEAAKREGRITDISVDDAVVYGTVLSQHRISTWSFTIDFNDDGELTGDYTVFSENDDSNVPQRLANEISKEIVYRLNRLGR